MLRWRLDISWRLAGCALVAAGATLLSACQGPTASTEGEKVMTFALTSTAFRNDERVPALYTPEGKNVSPPLAWADPPAGAAAFALVCDDPDAPRGTWDHWVLWNLPAAARKLPEGIAKTETPADLGNARQGRNSGGEIGYDGPLPPPGKVHHYNFVLYALDAPLDLKAGADKKALLATLNGHVLGQAKLTGTYSRS
jgi:Raf kinase inhibitor-like YbhB/YbcL family protein